MNRWAMISGDAVLTITEQDTSPCIPGTWINVTDASVGPGWRRDGDKWLPPVEARQTILTPREFILRMGTHYAAIQRLRDENAALPPDEKNYDLVRMFALWDAASCIDLTDADLVSAFGAFVAMGILTQADAEEILGG